MAEKENEVLSKREEMARNGELHKMFGQTNFVTFKPAYSSDGIDMVKVAFVVIGQNGKGFDIYITLDEFDILCDDILDKSLWKSILAEKPTAENRYPHSFQYITGDNGEKEIKISRGKKADCNIYGKCGKQFMNVPVRYPDLRIMAKWFKRTSKKRFEQLTNITMDALEKESRYHKKRKKTSAKEVRDDESVTNSYGKADIITVHIEGMFQKKKNLFVIDAILNNRTVQLYFNKASIETLGEDEWEQLQRKVALEKTELRIHAVERDGSYLFINMA